MLQYREQDAEIIKIVDVDTETVTVRLADGEIVSGVSLGELLGDESEIAEEYKRIEYVMLGASLLEEHRRPHEGSDLEKVITKDGFIREVITCTECRRVLSAEQSAEGITMKCTTCGKKVELSDLIELVENTDGELIPYVKLRR